MGRYWNGRTAPSPARPLGSGSGGTGQSSYTAGDILIAKADGKLYRKAIGSNGQILSVDTSDAQKTKWVTPGGGGGSSPWTLLNTITPSGGSVSVSNPGGYRNLLITGVDVVAAESTAFAYHYLRFYVNGTGLNAGNPSYRYSPSSMNNNEQFTGEARGYDAATAVKFNFRMLLSGINNGSRPNMNIRYVSYGNNMPPLDGLWQWWATSFTGIDFYVGGGSTFAGGTMKLFGCNDEEIA